MRKSYAYRSQALRFRRWSRKAYAAFISVQRAVTIGQLSFSVADRFQKKNLSLHTGIGTFVDGFFEVDEEERENTGEDKWSLAISHGLFAALLPVLASNEIAHPAHRVAHYTLYNIAKARGIRKDISRLYYFHHGVSKACIYRTQTTQMTQSNADIIFIINKTSLRSSANSASSASGLSDLIHSGIYT